VRVRRGEGKGSSVGERVSTEAEEEEKKKIISLEDSRKSDREEEETNHSDEYSVPEMAKPAAVQY